MKLETQSLSDHQVKLIVELDAEKLESAKRRAARRLSERKSISGFRPGKAPYEVIVRSFGDGMIVEEAVDILLDEIYPEALKESNVEPAAPGSLEKVENLETKPKFTFIVPLAPSVELGDYRAIRLAYEWHEPDEDKVESALEDMRQMYAKTEMVSRPIDKGDFVLVDLKGVGLKAIEGEAPLFERNGFPVFIRGDKKKDDEWPYAGFSTELLGLSIGDQKLIEQKYSNDYVDESLRGQTIQISVTIKMVRGTILPEMDDDFAKMMGPFNNMDALREAVKANLAAQSRGEYDDEYFNKLIENIKKVSVIKYASQTVDHEMEQVIEDIKSRLAVQGMDLGSYLKTRDMDEEKFIADEARPVAIKRLERSLILDEIAKHERIELDKELLNRSFQQTWSELQSNQSFQKSMRGKSQPSKQLMNLVARESAGRAYVQQTLDRIKTIAIGELKEITPAKEDKKDKKVSGPASSEVKGKKTSNKKKMSKP